MRNLHNELFDENLIDEDQLQFLDAVHKRKIISVHFELRILLYLGIMLFTGGIGYVVYQNMSEMGHVALMTLLGISIVGGGYYIKLKSIPYSNEEVQVDHIYFDYVLVLVSLLVISLFTYVQVYFDLVELLVKWTSLVSGVLFVYMAYRYDNKMTLSMGITAFAAVFGLTVSPVNWVSGDWLEAVDIYVLSLIFGLILLVVGQVLHMKNIKKHFTFTYHNFGLLLTYFGALALMFDFYENALAAFLLLVFAAFSCWYTWRNKLFLFFLYSSISGYIAFTFLFFSMGVDEVVGLYYFPISCIGGVVLLVKHRKHFSND